MTSKRLRRFGGGSTPAMESGIGVPQDSMRDPRHARSEEIARGIPDSTFNGRRSEMPAQASGLGRADARMPGGYAQDFFRPHYDGGGNVNPVKNFDRGGADAVQHDDGSSAREMSLGRPMGKPNGYASGGSPTAYSHDNNGDERLARARALQKELDHQAFKRGGSVEGGMRGMAKAMQSDTTKEPQMRKMKATNDMSDVRPCDREMQLKAMFNR